MRASGIGRCRSGSLFLFRYIMTTIINRFSLRRAFSRLSAVLLMILLFSAGAAAEKWKLHPAFDNSPVRIIDTEKYTFFQVFQKLYHTGAATYKDPVTAGFVYMKDSPEKGIFPMSDAFKVRATSVGACEYSPEGSFLAILYTDGRLDIVSDSGEVRQNDDLADCFYPGWGEVNSMTLSGTEIWIATPAGYFAVDGATGRTLALANLQTPIDRVGRCGSHIVAFADAKVWLYDKGGYPSAMSDFHEAAIEGAPGNPQLLLPRHDGSFAYLSPKDGGGVYTLNVAYNENGTWKNKHLFDLWLPVAASQMIITNPFEINFIRNRDGWAFFSGDSLLQLYIDGSPNDNLTASTPIVRKDNPSVSRSVSAIGSWDGSECWAYLDRGLFSPGRLEESRLLIDDAAAVRPSAPITSHATHFDYSPQFGLVSVNYGCSWHFLTLDSRLPPLISAHKEGVWSLPSPAYNTPRSAEADSRLMDLYRNYFYRFPVPNPTGIIFDSENGDYVWLGSSFGGLAALNLKDIKADPLHFGAPADPLASYPGFKVILEDENGWMGYNPLSAPSFDADGTLWAAYHHIDGSPSGDSPARLLYWPKENRMKVLASGDVALADGIGFIDIPSADLNATTKCLALRQPGGRNLVFMYVSGSPRFLARLNHKGTLNKRNDDVIDNIYYIEDQHGARWPISYCHDFKEDPFTGEIWVAESTTLLSFDPCGEVKDGVIKGRVLDIAYEGGAGNPLSQISCNDLTFDSAGRLWVSTTGLGVWGISADRKKADAHYNTANSSLPSDICYGLGWDHSAGSLMVSTEDGFAEVWPEAPASSANLSRRVSVTPRAVSPDFAGSVLVRGALPLSRINIEAKDGSKVALLDADADGAAEWNLKDKDGADVSPGFYILSGDFGSVEIAVMR